MNEIKIAIIDRFASNENEQNKELIDSLNQRKTLTTYARLSICNDILSNYSLLRKNKGIMHEQMFSAMEDYLKRCIETNYEITGL